MSSQAVPMPASSSHTGTLAQIRAAEPGYQAFWMLRIAFTAAPILFGIDKFANVMVHWPKYLAPWINDIVPGTAQQAMYAVGVIEIVAGLAVLVKPRYGAWLVAAWLGRIVVNLLTYAVSYDIALRVCGRILGALTWARRAPP